MNKPLNTLVIGSGGREHALVRSCLASPLCASVAAAPGNGGMAREVSCYEVDVTDAEAVAALAATLGSQLVIIGPEVALCAGVADRLRAAGCLVYGPGAREAQLEGSKVFAKEFCQRYAIPTARSHTFRAGDEKALEDYLADHPLPIVVKASGLAAGKGVIIAATREEALEAGRRMLSGESFGTSGQELLIEEFLQGSEASVTLMISGTSYLMLPPAQDHKCIGEGDTGANTGGMGAYAPAPVATGFMEERLRRDIIEPTLRGFAEEGFDFRGTLFIGVMIGKDGPRVLEYNVRFGDPETQVLLPLLQDDPVALMLACAEGKPLPVEIKCHAGSALVVVLAAEGYPGEYAKGDTILLPEDLPEGVQIIHAGTRLATDGSLRSHGGRVLGVSARASSLGAARKEAYAVCESIQWERKYYRRDIGWRAL